jgi:hypothetical protein
LACSQALSRHSRGGIQENDKESQVWSGRRFETGSSILLEIALSDGRTVLWARSFCLKTDTKPVSETPLYPDNEDVQ